MVKLKEEIFWVGYIDWYLRNFHGYSTPHGSSYNAYLILDQSNVLIDTVKHYGYGEFLTHIKRIIDPAQIDYIVANHAEMDHSGSLPKLTQLCPQAKVIVSPQGKKNLDLQLHQDLNYVVVEDGQTLSIGKRNLQFFHAPMVHWPDSMVTYCPEDKMLFSNDAFGQHYASDKLFVDVAGSDILMQEAAKYYANIVMPYGENVKRFYAKIKDLPIELIAPGHGLLWRTRQDIEKILSATAKWADNQTEPQAIIAYDTMWGSTQKIALKIKDELEQRNIPVQVMDLKINHISDIVTELLTSRLICLGSSVINTQILPTVGQLITYLKGLRPQKRYGISFGSYGWSNRALDFLQEGLGQSGIEVLDDGLYFQFVPQQQQLAEAVAKVMPSIEKIMN